MRCFIFVVLAILVGSALVNCSGGAAAPTPTPTPVLTRVRLAVHWPSLTRLTMNATRTARSAVIIVGTGGPVRFSINRESRTDSYTETLVSSNQLLSGEQWCSVEFYTEPDQRGSVIAVGGNEMTLEHDGTLTGEFSIGTSIVSVMIPPGQTLYPTETKDIHIAVLDNRGHTMAIPPGSASWSFADTESASRASITANQMLLGLAPGMVRLRATVDGVVSSDAEVAVSPPIQVAVSPSQWALVPGESRTFAAQVKNTDNTAVTWSVLEGAAGGSVTQNGVYTAPQARGTYHLVATSVATPRQSSQAVIKVGASSGVIQIQ